ncbi:hypothetical protein GGI07_003641 [Coemansia sp. Benny D115]|nr:hypothetical protein GGI07_003641 [Coemansia sp. Benny D115]
MPSRGSAAPTRGSVQIAETENDTKLYPLEPNGIELMLGGLCSSLALISPRKGLNIYENPVKYLCVSAAVLFGYYAVLTFGGVYCFKTTDRRRRQALTLGSRVMSVVNMAVATGLAAVVLGVLFVLFGAPFASQTWETVAAAVNVSLLAVTPAILTLKGDFGSWRRALLSANPRSVPEKWAAGIFWSTMVVCWAAAYFIPMDWERPWQKWPIPIVGGAFLGHIIGLLVVLLRCFAIPACRSDFDESERIKREMTRLPNRNTTTANNASSSSALPEETKKVQ